MNKAEVEQKLLEMLIKNEIEGYGISGDEITIFVLRGRNDVIEKIKEVFGDSGFNITIVEVEKEFEAYSDHG